MGAEPGFISSHEASFGSALVQTTPHIQLTNGEPQVNAGSLMSMGADKKAYLCGLSTENFMPVGFAATDNPLSFNVDCTSKITLAREGRLKGFRGLVPGAFYYPSSDMPGAVVPERGFCGPVISDVTAFSGTGFLRNVHIRAGHRPLQGVWSIIFPTTTTCFITSPDGASGASVTIAADSAYNGTISAGEDFYIETRTITPGAGANFTVSYSDALTCLKTPDSPGNAFTSAVALEGRAGSITRGIYKVVTTATTVTVGFNGGSQSPAKAIAASSTYFDIIPGVAMSTQSESVEAETNYYLVDSQMKAPVVGMAVDSSTLQILMGGTD